MRINVGIVDDQRLFVKSLSNLINSFQDFKVVIEAFNGEDLLKNFQSAPQLPDILLVDVKMPLMDGPSLVSRLSKTHPSIKTVALSMKEDDYSVLSMLRVGCSAYLLKDVEPNELEIALRDVFNIGYYNVDSFNKHNRRLMRSLLNDELKLTDREKTFLRLACSDFTYKEIADKMFLSEKTIDGYRESLFRKLNVKSRVGMALEAIKLDLVTI